MSKRVLALILLAIIAIFLFRHAGSFLVVANNPQRADLVVVLAGGGTDVRYWNGIRLMQEGYAPHLMLDVFSKGETFGNSDIDLAKDFLDRTTPGKSTVCPIAENSTYDEVRYLAECLQGSSVKSILIVTSEYHTRRALSILRKRLPQYDVSIYAASDPYFFGQQWWQRREWAKTTYGEWQRYLWWSLVDRWRSGLVLTN